MLMNRLSLRGRMMLLFCTAVGVLLASTLCVLYVLFSREMDSQFNCRLQKAAMPVVTVLASEPDSESRAVSELKVPDEYFEVLDASGHVLQKSKNLARSELKLSRATNPSRETFETIEDEDLGRQRVILVPFTKRTGQQFLALSMPARRNDSVLASFRQLIMWLLPISLLVTASISTWYVGRSLRPVKELTSRAARLTEIVGQAPPCAAESNCTFNIPLVVSNPGDELDRLAVTFNRLFNRIDVVMRQLRQFVTDASHELRTPLAILQGETELLLSRPRTVEEYERTVRVMDGELKTLTRIVESLFTLSMADSGQLRLMREPLYLNEVLEQACMRVEPIADSKRICIRRDLTLDLAYFGDEAFLQELALIFVDNAIKYSPCDTEVRVQLKRVDDEVRITFEDQGYGIASEDCPRIFERFFRGHNVGSSESRSGGLGLAIAKAIVDAQGGSIQCNSVLGSNTTFIVTLPYIEVPPVRVENRGSSAETDPACSSAMA
jgi:two-component system OmpR family sensor kinase